MKQTVFLLHKYTKRYTFVYFNELQSVNKGAGMFVCSVLFLFLLFWHCQQEYKEIYRKNL